MTKYVIRCAYCMFQRVNVLIRPSEALTMLVILFELPHRSSNMYLRSGMAAHLFRGRVPHNYHNLGTRTDCAMTK